jgi:hypothetical protein
MPDAPARHPASGASRRGPRGAARQNPVATAGRRAVWAFAGAAFVYVAVVVDDWGWWLLVPALAPDLPLLFGVGAGLSRGQLHGRAVPAYNLTHSIWGSAAAISVGLGWARFGGHSGVLVVGLVWGTHVAFDRACGYGLRTPAGFQQ